MAFISIFLAHEFAMCTHGKLNAAYFHFKYRWKYTLNENIGKLQNRSRANSDFYKN